MTHELNGAAFFRLPEILKILPIGRSTWWAKVKSGEYPQPVKLGPRTTAWRAQDIRALVERISQVAGGSNHE